MSSRPAPIRRRKLAIRLTELRKSAAKSQVKTASWTGLSQSTISKIENAAQPIEVKHVRLLAQCYGVNSPEMDQLLRMTVESDYRGLLVDHSDTIPDFIRDYVELELQAEELRVHEPALVFGLFQTAAYIRAVHLEANPEADEEVLERFVALRMARQERLKAARPPILWVILDEAVLHRAIGGPTVMAEQLARLVEVSELPNVTLQLVPFAAGSHSAVGAGFTVLRFAGTPTMDVVYVETLRMASYLEKPSDLDHHVRMFEKVTRAALDPDDSRRMLTTLKHRLWER